MEKQLKKAIYRVIFSIILFGSITLPYIALSITEATGHLPPPTEAYSNLFIQYPAHAKTYYVTPTIFLFTVCAAIMTLAIIGLYWSCRGQNID